MLIRNKLTGKVGKVSEREAAWLIATGKFTAVATPVTKDKGSKRRGGRPPRQTYQTKDMVSADDMAVPEKESREVSE